MLNPLAVLVAHSTGSDTPNRPPPSAGSPLPLFQDRLPEIHTTITHLREFSATSPTIFAHAGEHMTNAAMATYALNQIDLARTELEHPSYCPLRSGGARRGGRCAKVCSSAASTLTVLLQSVATITEPPPEPPLPPNAALAQSPLKRGDWQLAITTDTPAAGRGGGVRRRARVLRRPSVGDGDHARQRISFALQQLAESVADAQRAIRTAVRDITTTVTDVGDVNVEGEFTDVIAAVNRGVDQLDDVARELAQIGGKIAEHRGTRRVLRQGGWVKDTGHA